MMQTETQTRTVPQVVQKLRLWEAEHQPMDRVSRLPLFQYMVEPGKGGALVPLSNGNGSGVQVYQPTGALQVSQPTLHFNAHAHDQLLTRLGFPPGFYKRLTELQAEKLNLLIVNTLIQKGVYDKECLFRIIDGDQVRALMSARYEPFDDLQLLTIAEPYLPPDSEVRWEYRDDLSMHLSITFPRTATEVKVGDIVQQGIHLSNSEVGVRSVTMASFLWRLKCLNGAIGMGDGEFYRFRHTGDSEKMSQSVAAAIQSTMLEAEKITAQFKAAVDKAIEQPFEFMEKVAKGEGMSQETFKACLDAYLLEPDPSLFGVSQSFSRAAQSFKGEDSYELQKLSTKVLSMN